MNAISPNVATELHGGKTYVKLPKGNLKPIEAIKPEDIEEDELVRSLIIKAVNVNALLVAFRNQIFDNVTAFRELLLEKYDVKKGGAKGNLTLTTLDGKLKLKIQVADTLTFGPKLEVAKAIVDECIRDWSDGANDNLRILVDQAFQVDKQGKISTDKILGLRRHNIKDASGKWDKAMAIISDAIRVVSSKEHARFYLMLDSGEEKRLALDLANA